MSTWHLVHTCSLVGALILAGHARPHGRAQDPALSVRITSPLGRTGMPGAVRIVAQIQHAPELPPGEVRFYVDDRLLSTVARAPYAVEWTDENPFERTEIAVEAVDPAGHAVRDNVVLEPFEVTEAAEVTSVLVEASVQDKAGRFVRGLDASRFQLTEDGAPQKLDLVMQQDMGATFALLVDRSGSMSRRLDFVQRTAATLAGYMTERDRMLIAPFSRQVGPLTGPTNDRPTIIESIDAIQSAGGTAILDSLAQSSRLFEGVEGRRAIVLITDGYDEHSTTSFEEALTAIKASGATLYVVGIGGVAGISIRGERLLRQLATDTGGRFFFPARDGQLDEVHDVLTADLRNRYLITYTPENQKIDGSWRAIALSSGDPTHVVRARPGYFAPKPPPIRPAIEFTAYDGTGRYLDLTSDDLEVIEDGVRQEIESFQEAVEPVSIVLALDTSGSMKHKEAQVVESARTFVDELRPADSLAVILFADKAVLAHDLTTKREESHAAIQEYKATGGTALYDALTDALVRLKTAPGRRVVVVMTDGRDENHPGTAPGSVHRFEDVLEYQKESGAMIFGIGLGTKVDAAPLGKLAEVSGGRALFPQEVDQLDAEFRRVIDDLRRRYVIAYTSTQTRHDGEWRKVEIRITSVENATVRSSGGYLAPTR